MCQSWQFPLLIHNMLVECMVAARASTKAVAETSTRPNKGIVRLGGRVLACSYSVPWFQHHQASVVLSGR